MSSELQELSLTDICSDVSYGYTESATDEPIGPKFLRITDIQGGIFDWDTVPYCPATDANVIKYRLEIGDIVVARTGNSTGENAQINKEPPSSVFASYLIRFRPDAKQVNPFFIGYQLRSDRFRQHVLAVRGGSAQPGANAKQLGAFPIRLIPRHLQDSAVEILCSIDDRIALLRETNATLEAIAQAMFKSWFVDFDPVHANATLPSPRGRGAGGEGNNASRHPHPSPLPAGEGVQSMSVAIPARGTPVCAPGVPPDPSAAAALFPDSFEESEMGLVPRGWKVEPLTEVFDFREGPGIRNWQYTNTDQGTRFINIRCIQDGDLSIDTANRITDEEANGKYAHFHLRAWDVVVSTSGTLGRSAIVRQEHLPLMLNTSVIRFQPIQEKMRFSFVYEYLNSTEFLFKLESMASGSVQKNFGPMHLKQMKLVCPPIDLLAHYDAICRPLFEKVVANRARIQTLATLRDTLLPRLISGQLRLPEAEALLEELA